MELPRSTGKIKTQQCRGVVGLPMMVLALVIGKGSSNNNEGCSDKINNKGDGRFDSSCLVCWEETSVYFFRQMIIYLFCMRIWMKASICEVGRRNIYPTKPTSTHSYCFFPISVSRFLAEILFFRCEVGRRNIHPAKPTSTYSNCFFPISLSRCRFGGIFLLHQTYIYSLLLLIFC